MEAIYCCTFKNVTSLKENQSGALLKISINRTTLLLLY